MPRDGTLPVLKDKLSTDPLLKALVAVDELLSDEGAWLQGHLSNVEGTQHCLMGARNTACSEVGSWDFAEALGFEMPTDVMDFNDTHTFPEVKALLAEAIARRTAQLMRGES